MLADENLGGDGSKTTKMKYRHLTIVIARYLHRSSSTHSLNDDFVQICGKESYGSETRNIQIEKQVLNIYLYTSGRK